MSWLDKWSNQEIAYVVSASARHVSWDRMARNFNRKFDTTVSGNTLKKLYRLLTESNVDYPQEEIDFIQVTTNKSIISKINEMEWINGKIYANTYQFNKDVVVIINPINGEVEGVIDFSGLKEKVKQHKKLNVLNGIAYHKKRKTLFVTGKNWNKLFEVKITPKI